MKNINEISCFKDVDSDFILDFLTQSLNKENLFHYINYLVYNQKPFSLYFFDTDEFKKLNDTYGHAYGDYILKSLINIVSNTIGDNALVGRFGGDEFIVIAEDITEYDDVWAFARKISEEVREFSAEEMKRKEGVYISITIGISRFPIDGKNIDELLRVADKALYRGKKKGRNCFIIYNPVLHSKISATSDSSLDTISIIENAYNIFSNKNLVLDKQLDEISSFLEENFVIDSIFITDSKEFKYYWLNNKYAKLGVIPDGLYDTLFENNLNMCVINSREYIFYTEPKLYSIMMDCNIRSSLIFKVHVNDNYHYIHINVHRARVWSHEEKIIMLSIFNMYGLIAK